MRPQYVFDVNTSGTAYALEVVRLANVKKVIFSSPSPVYVNNLSIPLLESETVSPDLIYAISKIQVEQIYHAYAKNYGIDIGICRFFNVYGPHQVFKRTLPPYTSYIARELVANRVPKLFDRTDVKGDYIHVSDVINLLVMMIKHQESMNGQTHNILSGQAFSVP